MQESVKGIMSSKELLDAAAIALTKTACNPFVTLALENHSATTVLSPSTIAAVCLILIAMIVYRRPVQGRLARAVSALH